MRIPWTNSAQKRINSSNKIDSSLDSLNSLSVRYTTKLTIGDDEKDESNCKTMEIHSTSSGIQKSEQNGQSSSSSQFSPQLNGRGVFKTIRDEENGIQLKTEWSEQQRRRLYRIALNFFNKNPDHGVQLLIRWGFVEGSPKLIARLFRERRGLSRQMIGEYLGTLRSPFHKKVLEHFISDLPMHNVEIDIALRQLLKHFRLPGEAQKIDHIIQTFAHSYVAYNPDKLDSTINVDSMYILAFAIIMLNTDLHTPSLKDSKRMKLEEFINNLCRVEEGKNLDKKMLASIYERIKEFEFRTDHDHVSQVMKLDQCIVSKDKPKLIEPHRRLISHCIVNQIFDPNKRQSSSAHLREIILFNDVLLVCKLIGGMKRSPSSSGNRMDQFQLRYFSVLIGLQVQEFQNSLYPFAFMLNFPDGETLMFNAKNSEDRYCFVTDIRESIAESTEMEQWRISFTLSFDFNCI